MQFCNTTTDTMFPLYRLGFTPLWNSYWIGLLFQLKTNNSARFPVRTAIITQRFWKWYKIYRIGFTTAWKHAEVQWKQLNWLISVQFWFLSVKTGNVSKVHNLIERLNNSSESFEYFFQNVWRWKKKSRHLLHVA